MKTELRLKRDRHLSAVMIRYKKSLLSLTGISPLDLLKEYEGGVS